MKKIAITLLLVFILVQITNAQNAAYFQIEKTLTDYIEGSAYNQLEQLESAFAENATLYLTMKDNVFKKISPKDYASFFSNRKKGSFNGRVGKILNIDIHEDISTAKVEILIPKAKLHFIDLFLLKKIKNNWKIISKTATQIPSNKTGNSILFVVSNAHYYGKTKLSTGNSFSEIVNSYDVFEKAGYTIDFVSPEGGAVPLAYINTSDSLSKKYLYKPAFIAALKHTKKPKQVDVSQYKAIQYIGGGAAMFGVPENKEIQKIAMDIYENNNGIISSVCHGTAGIINLKTKDGNYLIKGKRVSGYPDDYEYMDRAYFKTFPFLIKQTIESRGGVFLFSKRNTSHVEVDGRLITGQNYLSSEPVSLKIIELLKK